MSILNWSDRKKWLMGILSALIVAAMIAITGKLLQTRDSPKPEDGPHKAPVTVPDQSQDHRHQDPPKPPIVAVKTPPPPEVKKAQGYEFSLQECSASGSDLECWITVRNTLQRRSLSVMGRSRLVDQNGTTHNADLLESDGSWGGSLFINVDLATDVPGRFGLRFKGMGEYKKAISLLDVDASRFHVEWRDVEVR